LHLWQGAYVAPIIDFSSFSPDMRGQRPFLAFRANERGPTGTPPSTFGFERKLASSPPFFAVASFLT
jgi:hypothetical protein